jgi:hypothetical protein
MEQTPLESFFADEDPDLTAAPEQAEPSPPRDESGRFAAKDTGVEPAAEAEPAADADTVPPTADKLPPETFKGLKEEREKRQRLEQELDQLRQQFQATQQQQVPPAPPPSIWEDEQAYGGHIVSTAVQQANMNAVLNMSEMLNRREKPDFETMKVKFLQLAEVNPVIAQQALADPDPWGRAYQIAKNAATMEEIGATDIDTLKARLREELLAEAAAQVPAAINVPPSLTTARNVAQRGSPAWSGPRSLDELLG